MLQRLGIRGKLLAVVAVPTIVLLLAASFVVWSATSTYSSSRNSSELTRLIALETPLVAALQAERTAVTGYLRAVTDGDSDRLAARNRVDITLETLRQAANADPSFAPIYDGIMVALAGTNGKEGLTAARSTATFDTVAGAFPAYPDVATVNTQIDMFTRLASQVATTVENTGQDERGALARSLPGLIRSEASVTQLYLDDSRAGAEAIPGAFQSVDRAKALVDGAVAVVNASSENEVVLKYVASASKGLGGLADLRAQVYAGTAQIGVAQNAYTDIIANLLSSTRETANVAGDRVLANYLKGFVSVADLIESVRLEGDFVTRKIAQGYWRAGETTQFQAYYFGSNNALINAQNAVKPLVDIKGVPDFGASYSLADSNGYQNIRESLLNAPTDQSLLNARRNAWGLQVQKEVAADAPILVQLSDAVANRAAGVERSALVQTLATIAVAIAAIAASLFIALSISRRIVNPLRRLTTTATAVRQELPRLVERVAMPGQTVDLSEVQIPVESQDEVGRLAEAFNSVNAATLAIAAEQAALRGSISEMFVNVARRDQVLLNRQLASIDEMERTEDNQITLTKLFALDHLATRMRRNSESLLVLAGIDTGRRLRRPMPLSDVIRTASSEIELYERIQLELDSDPAMLGHSALTAAHLFAELLENATVFSDPGTQVVVRTMERDGAFVVTIVDHGIGMTSEELAEANSRVASTAASEILGAQRLGLFVVGRIARRVGARVHIESAEGRGTEATVVMPPSLFDTSVAYQQGHSSGSTADDRLHAPAALVHHDATIEEVTEPALTSRGLSAYKPTVIEDGASLAGRPADAPDLQPPPAALAPRGVPEPIAPRGVPEPIAPQEIDQLVAADAAEAPAAVAFDLDEFTEGVTDVGLPTRRRRAPAGPEASHDTNSIIALPQRASDEQLSALRSATTSGFTPILAADEVSPESAEARSRVFRGFRPLRGIETEPAALAPDAESLGHAMRRGIGSGDALVDGAVPTMADYEPAPLRTGPVPTIANGRAAEAFEPEDRTHDRASDVMRNFAADEADRRDPEHPTVRQSPLITTGYVEDNALSAADSRAVDEPFAEMLVPMLEDDDEPMVTAPYNRERPIGDDRWTGADDGAGVDAVSLDEAPQRSAPARAAAYRSPLYPVAPNPWQQQVRREAQSQAAPVAPVAGNPWQQQVPREAQFEADPVTSVPSLDDLIMDGAGSARGEERGGFFSRLFGKQGKSELSEHPAAAPMPYSAPQGPPPEAVTMSPAPSWAMPAPEPEPEPEPSVAQAARQPFGSTSLSEAAPQENWAVAEEPPVHGGYRDDFSPATPMPAPVQEPAPVADRSPYGSAGGENPVQDEDLAPQWTMLPPLSYPNPAPYADGSGFGAAPIQPGQVDSRYGAPSRYDMPTGNAQQNPAQSAFGADHPGVVYSPDQLARPLGWETAGASALQAAAPESATEYRPVVQISPDSSISGQEDFASAVFSELSSLAAERPKVETTRAGLAKRTPVAREVVSDEPVQAAPSAPRDAEAVRSRFSAFYSGTQRAKDDVQNFNDSTQGSLTEP